MSAVAEPGGGFGSNGADTGTASHGSASGGPHAVVRAALTRALGKVLGLARPGGTAWFAVVGGRIVLGDRALTAFTPTGPPSPPFRWSPDDTRSPSPSGASPSRGPQSRFSPAAAALAASGVPGAEAGAVLVGVGPGCCGHTNTGAVGTSFAPRDTAAGGGVGGGLATPCTEMPTAVCDTCGAWVHCAAHAECPWCRPPSGSTPPRPRPQRRASGPGDARRVRRGLRRRPRPRRRGVRVRRADHGAGPQGTRGHRPRLAVAGRRAACRPLRGVDRRRQSAARQRLAAGAVEQGAPGAARGPRDCRDARSRAADAAGPPRPAGLQWPPTRSAPTAPTSSAPPSPRTGSAAGTASRTRCFNGRLCLSFFALFALWAKLRSRGRECCATCLVALHFSKARDI